MNVQERLAKFVNDTLLEKRLSTYDVEEKAKRAGLEITQSYVNRIKIAKVGNVSVPKQKALAMGLGVEPQEVYDIVNGVERHPTSFTDKLVAITAPAAHFTEGQQSELLRTIKLLVSAIQAENEITGTVVTQNSTKFDPKGIAKEDFQFESVENDRQEKSA